MISVCKFIKKGRIINWTSDEPCKTKIKNFITFKNGKQFYNEYCSEHGCRICGYSKLKGQYQNPKEDFKTNFGEEVCSLECKNEGEQKHYQKEAKLETEAKANIMDKMNDFDNQTTTEIKSIFAPFYEIIKEVRMNELRKEFLREQIKLFQFHAKCSSTIKVNSSLEPAEKEQWKKIYERVSSWKDLVSPCLEEKDFLVSLAKKHKNREEQAQKDNIPECKKCKLRREQPKTWPVGYEEWCKECIKHQNQEKNQTPNEQQPPVNDNDNTNPQPSDNSPKNEENNPPENSDTLDNSSSSSDNSNPQNDNNDSTERERERETTEPPTAE